MATVAAVAAVAATRRSGVAGVGGPAGCFNLEKAMPLNTSEGSGGGSGDGATSAGPANDGAGRSVLITGCSSGIGRATAERLASRGWRVYATARRLESIADLAPGCQLVQLDVTDEQSMRAAVAAVESQEGAVGALVNNAGYSQSGAIESVPLDAARRQFETNFFGAVRLIQLVLPGMRRAGRGRIVNISSMGGRLVLPGGGFYHASKFALEALSDALRFEVEKLGVRVVVIQPGVIRTRFAEKVTSHMQGIAEEDPAYAEFNHAVNRLTASAYEGATARLLPGPEAVARKVERALTSRRPRSRYIVGLDARAGLVARRLLPDRAWDRAMSVAYPRPSRRGAN